MKTLTIIATIFLPLTFIASIYGMNFEFMPELHHPWGYPIVLGIMALLGGAMFWWFKRRGWFD
jgi:magnesium transporter